MKDTLKQNTLCSVLEFVAFVDGQSFGVPPKACAVITPQYGTPSQPANTLPYTVNLSDFTANSYIGGQSYQITLQSRPTDLDYRGLMIQGRLAADRTTPIGELNSNSGIEYRSECSSNSDVADLCVECEGLVMATLSIYVKRIQLILEVEEKPMWDTDDIPCLHAKPQHGYQAERIIDGKYTDYIMESIFSPHFCYNKFKM